MATKYLSVSFVFYQAKLKAEEEERRQQEETEKLARIEAKREEKRLAHQVLLL